MTLIIKQQQPVQLWQANAGGEGAPTPTAPDAATAPPVVDGPTTQEPEGQPFPADTPVAEMTLEHQAAYWKHQSRKHESRAKAQSDYDAVKAKADQFDELQRQSESDHEKALREAVEAARAEVTQEANERAAGAILRANLDARNVSPETAALLLSGFSPSTLLKDDGDVDTDKVSQLVDALAPAAPKSPSWPDMGQGKRPSSTGSGTQAGRDAYRARHQKNNTNA